MTRVIGTHLHPDHVGMAGWLTKRFECELWMSELEYLAARDATVRRDEVFESSFRGFFRAAGFTRDEVAQLQTSFASFGRYYHPLPEDYRRIRDGEQITIGEHEWSVIIGSGHSPEHACLLNPSLGLLISGDQVLQRISSNVSVIPNQPAANPLQDWLDSLDKLRSTVNDDVLVLPSHDVPFRGLYRRLQELRAQNSCATHLSRDRRDPVPPELPACRRPDLASCGRRWCGVVSALLSERAFREVGTLPRLPASAAVPPPIDRLH